MKMIEAYVILFGLAILILLGIIGLAVLIPEPPLRHCNCTVNFNNASIPVEDAIEGLSEGIQELNDSFEAYCNSK